MKNASFMRLVLTVVLFAFIGLAIFTLRGASAQSRSDQSSSISMADRLGQYTSVRLTADLSGLSQNQRRMIPLLIEAAGHMNDAFWMQAYGDKNTLMASIKDLDTRQHVTYNYGPWDRLRGNESFVKGVSLLFPGEQ